MKRSSLIRKTPLRSKKGLNQSGKSLQYLKRRKPMKKRGKLTVLWGNIRKALKPRFQAAGITSCEIKFSQCWRDYTLGFLHLKKRRNCNEADLWKTVLGCGSCHTAVEGMGEKNMGEFLQGIINAREVQP